MLKVVQLLFELLNGNKPSELEMLQIAVEGFSLPHRC